MKLKLIKIFDIIQPERALMYTLLSGLIRLDLRMVADLLLECVAITFLLYPLFF